MSPVAITYRFKGCLLSAAFLPALALIIFFGAVVVFVFWWGDPLFSTDPIIIPTATHCKYFFDEL